MGVQCEGVKGATAKPPCRLRRGETPATQKNKFKGEAATKWRLTQELNAVGQE